MPKIKYHLDMSDKHDCIRRLIWSIDFRMTSRKQYFSYIRDNNKFINNKSGKMVAIECVYLHIDALIIISKISDNEYDRFMCL
jgi:hypothetical protein